MAFLTILIILLSLVILLIIHELGHFLIAKKLGVMVEEFGIGYPPRLIGKKIGETIYSINLLPFGAFVRIMGEEDGKKGKRSFASRPIWQRALIIVGGVASFWLAAFLIISFIALFSGIPQAVGDNYHGRAYVQIIDVAKNSPAEKANLKPGDIVEFLSLENRDNKSKIDRVSELIDFINSNKGEKVEAGIIRRGKLKKVDFVPRKNPPKGEGAVGIAIARVANVKYSWYKAFWVGAKITAIKTVQIPEMSIQALVRYLKKEKVEGVKLVGPIGIGNLMGNALSVGWQNFLMFLAMIAIWLAIFNILPIPALDGGKLLFLAIEAIRKKPVSQKVEQQITGFFFVLLLLLMVVVTINDIVKIF